MLRRKFSGDLVLTLVYHNSKKIFDTNRVSHRILENSEINLHYRTLMFLYLHQDFEIRVQFFLRNDYESFQLITRVLT